ncbi:MAG: hypothetical protein K5840_08845 [Eubacterium sp.]|nr:hypothetical protein [Eubacterium sp.]
MAVSSIGIGTSVSEILEEAKSSLSDTTSAEELNEKLQAAYEEKYKEYLESLQTGTSTSSTKSAYTALSQEGEDVSDALKVMQEALAGGDTETIATAVSDFASCYNSLLSGLSSASSAECTALMKQFQSYFSENEDVLEAAGISISSSGKLSVDSEVLASADLSEVTELFASGSTLSSNIDKLSASVVSVATLKISGYNALQTLYGNSGELTSKNLTATLLDILG